MDPQFSQTTMTNGHPLITPERIAELASGYALSLIMEAAIRYNIFDILDDGPRTVQEVRDANGASVRGLTAVMNALAGLGLMLKDHQGRFSLAPESSVFLVSTKPEFQGGLLRRCSQYTLPRWLRLNEIVATGKPADAINQQLAGTAFFRELVSDLFRRNYPAAKSLARHLLDGPMVVRNCHTVLDLGAGSGVWGIALAQNSPEIRITAVDWPEVLSITRETAARFGVLDRFAFVDGDLLHIDFGSGYSVATLGHILHSEGAQRSRALIAKTFDALLPGGTIAIAEFLVNADRTGPLNALLFAVHMLVNTERGDTYSFEEISAWLSEAGFVDARMLEVPGPSPLILATKPQSGIATEMGSE